MSERCVIYVRVSSEEQIAGTSLGSQEAACRAFAQRSGWTVDRVFAALRVAESMVRNMATIWDAAPAPDRLRFERAVFPDGIQWVRGEGIRTAATCSIFAPLQRLRFEKTGMAPLQAGTSNPFCDFDRMLRMGWNVRDLCA